MEPPEVAVLARSLAEAGIDIIQPLCIKWYNDSIPAELGARIPPRGAAGADALAILVANSRALWEAFLQALAANPDLLAADHPLEEYLEAAVGAALAAAAPGRPARLYWSHRRAADLEPPPGGGAASEHVALQRMAHHSGLAFLDHGSHLCLHPRYGPWFSLRCAIILDDTPYRAPKPLELPNPLPTATQRYVQIALHTAVHNTSRKFSLPEVEVEAAEAALAEASMELGLDSEEEEEEEGGMPACPGATRSTAGDEAACPSVGSTPAGSGGCGSPQAHADAASPPELLSGLDAAPLAGAGTSAAAGLDRASTNAGTSGPGPAATLSSLPLGSPPEAGSPGSCAARRGGTLREGRPSMRAVTANWQAWVAVRDSPCPGHPMRYSDEQIRYHYTRDRAVLAKALLRRNLVPATPLLPASALLHPALPSFRRGASDARKQAAQLGSVTAAPPPAAPVGTPITAP